MSSNHTLYEIYLKMIIFLKIKLMLSALIIGVVFFDIYIPEVKKTFTSPPRKRLSPWSKKTFTSPKQKICLHPRRKTVNDRITKPSPKARVFQPSA